MFVTVAVVGVEARFPERRIRDEGFFHVREAETISDTGAVDRASWKIQRMSKVRDADFDVKRWGECVVHREQGVHE